MITEDRVIEIVQESLRDWFKKENWVRINTSGNISGACGTMKKGKATTRCLPKKKAQSLSKAERKATVAKKVRGDKKGKQFVKNTKKAEYKKNNMSEFNYTQYLAEGKLFEDEKDQFKDDLLDVANSLASEIEDELEDNKKELNEVAGIVGILGYILLSNTVANMLSKISKRLSAKYEWGKGEEDSKKNI